MHQHLPSDHARHDLSLIAAHAAGDVAEADRPRADALLTTCTPCADLRRDLVAIASATRSVPPPFALARDFRLDEGQAARLRRGSRLRAFLAPFGASRSILRPLAAGVTSLGVAGLLVATMLPTALPGAMSTQRDNLEQAGAPSDMPVFQAQGSPDTENNAPASSGSDVKADPSVRVAAGGAATPAGGVEPEIQPLDAGLAPPNPLMVASLGLLALGLALFGLRFAARRVR
jgi:hypothetical protein